MSVKVKPATKNISLSERLKQQAESGVTGTMEFVSEISSREKIPAQHIQTVAESSDEMQNRIESVATGNGAESARPKVVGSPVEKLDRRTTRRKSGKFVDKFTFSFPEEEKLEFKAFAAAHGISITDLIMYSLDYLKGDVEENKISVSRYGVKKLG